MRSIIYDVITGIAIIIGLFVVTDVMKANQTFIFNQGNAETDVEQVYLDENAATKENTYTAADVYGTFHTLLKNGNNTSDSSKWMLNDYIQFVLVIGTDTYKVSWTSSNNIENVENQLKWYVKKKPNAKFTRKKSAVYNGTYDHKIVCYTFTLK